MQPNTSTVVRACRSYSFFQLILRPLYDSMPLSELYSFPAVLKYAKLQISLSGAHSNSSECRVVEKWRTPNVWQMSSSSVCVCSLTNLLGVCMTVTKPKHSRKQEKHHPALVSVAPAARDRLCHPWCHRVAGVVLLFRLGEGFPGRLRRVLRERWSCLQMCSAAMIDSTGL